MVIVMVMVMVIVMTIVMEMVMAMVMVMVTFFSAEADPAEMDMMSSTDMDA